MSIIYEPRGKAREYSPLAANFYSGCDHGCRYCYAPAIQRKNREDYLRITPRENIVSLFKKEADLLSGISKQILFNFMGDPYCSANIQYGITRQCLQIALANRLPIAVLTKGGERCLADLDVFRDFGSHIKVGATLTFRDPVKSAYWENGGASPENRIKALEVLHNNGVKTWTSFEPVIEPAESLAMIQDTLHCVDEYKIGKLNRYQGLDKEIGWTDFLEKAVSILRSAGKKFYIKQDLRIAAPSVILSEEEITADAHCVEAWTAIETDMF